MRNRTRSALGLGIVMLALSGSPVSAGVVLYRQDFENPTGFVNNGGDINIYRTINQLYGDQPPGFTFAQANTVETLLLTGDKAFRTGYEKDPKGIGGNYAISMLSGFSIENDLLGLSFNVQGHKFLNFQLNISSIDLDRFSGPFNPDSGSIPEFEITLFDNPTGTTQISGNGTVLDSTRITGAPSTSRTAFNWTEHIVALDASKSTNGNVTVRIDLVAAADRSHYAAMDNFRIAASDIARDVVATDSSHDITASDAPRDLVAMNPLHDVSTPDTVTALTSTRLDLFAVVLGMIGLLMAGGFAAAYLIWSSRRNAAAKSIESAKLKPTGPPPLR